MDEFEVGGFAMSDGNGDAIPENVDTLLAGGEPNQEHFRLDTDDMAVDEGTEIHEGGRAPAQAKPGERAPQTDPKAADKVPADLSADPVVRRLQAELSRLSPEQRAALAPASAMEIVHNGQKVQVAPEKQVPLMQMGLNYSEKMRALNVERQEFEKAKGTVTEHERYYGEIDRVAKANPEWWQHCQAEFQKFQGKAGNTGSGVPGNSEMNPELRVALSKITDLEGKLNGFLEQGTKQAEMKQHQAEDAELDSQINSFAKEHSDFDWMTADASGLVLADRIVAHANKNGINNFRAAARDFLFSDLISRRELRVKEDLGKSIQAKTRAGVVNPRVKPTGLRPPTNLNRGYDDLMSEGYRELGS